MKCKEAGGDTKIAQSGVRGAEPCPPQGPPEPAGSSCVRASSGCQAPGSHSVHVVGPTPPDSWVWRFLRSKPELLTPHPHPGVCSPCILAKSLGPVPPGRLRSSPGSPSPHPAREQTPWNTHPLPRGRHPAAQTYRIPHPPR